MKAVINGVHVEGSAEEIATYQQALQTGLQATSVVRSRTSETRSKRSFDSYHDEPQTDDLGWLESLTSSLTETQRKTFWVLPDASNEAGMHTSALARKLGIKPSAASQRCMILLGLGLIERVEFGRYRRVV